MELNEYNAIINMWSSTTDPRFLYILPNPLLLPLGESWEMALKKVIIPSTKYFSKPTSYIQIGCSCIESNFITGSPLMEVFSVNFDQTSKYLTYASEHISYYPLTIYNIRELELSVTNISNELITYKEKLCSVFHLHFRKSFS